ncbi:MAG: histidinol-phosphate transaminase [Promethearchaeota archaeon]
MSKNVKKIKEYMAKFMDRFRGYSAGEQPPAGWLKLNTNENPYEPPKSVIDDLKKGLENLRKYPDMDTKELKKQLTFNVRVDDKSALKMDNIVAGCGSDELLDIVFKTFVDPGDRVVYFDPSYGMYKVLTQMFRGTPVEIQLNEDFSIPIEKATSTPGKLFIICSPNNPTGLRVPNDSIAKICENFEGIVLVDEAYVDFANDSAISLLPRYNNLIIMRTFSKSFSLAALRIGYVISLERDVILALRKIRAPYSVNLAAQIAALSSLKHQDEVDETVKKIKEERQRVTEKIQEIEHLTVTPSESNFILVNIKAGDDEKKNQKITQKLFWELKKKKILVRWYMTKRLYTYLRVTIGTPEQNDMFIEALKTCLEFALQAA